MYVDLRNLLFTLALLKYAKYATASDANEPSMKYMK